MPELPEVETIRKGLLEKIKGKEVAGIEIYRAKLLKNSSVEELTSVLQGKTLQDIKRAGKFLAFLFDGGSVIIFHLKMAGSFYVPKEADEPLRKHTHLLISFTDNTQLRFYDPRHFGQMHFYPSLDSKNWRTLINIGIDPFEDDFNCEYLFSVLQKSKKEIKKVLMDQQLIAGIGNIYASEILFASGLHPNLRVNLLTKEQSDLMCQKIKDILLLALKQRGTSVRDYRDVDGEDGSFQHFLKVYQREGKECYHCGEKIKRIKQDGRSTFFCPHCQSADLI